MRRRCLPATVTVLKCPARRFSLEVPFFIRGAVGYAYDMEFQYRGSIGVRQERG